MTKDDRELIERLNAHSSKVPIGELRNDLRTAADTLATRLEALQAQPVGEEKPVCEHCGGNGYTGGVMPPEDMRGEYDVCCEVCLGSGKAPAALTASPPVVSEDESGWLIEMVEPDHNKSPVPRWWHPEHGWMWDANKALRFAREIDAQDYITGSGRLPGKPTEHIFLSAPGAES